MIFKPRDDRALSGALEQAGVAAERQMAFYLERAFGSDSSVFVLNDLRLERGSGDAIQIDHLVIHKHGMAIIESKSVCQGAAMTVDRHGEWTRVYRGEERGMPSPIKQAERQADALRELLSANKLRLREKRLFGLVQGGFGACPIDCFVAVSDRGMITRKAGADFPSAMKADLIPDTLRELIVRHRKAGSLLGTATGKGTGDDGLYELRESEIQRVAEFLRDNHRPLRAPGAPGAERSGRSEPPVVLRLASPVPPVPTSHPSAHLIEGHACRHCGTTLVAEVQWGNRAYYAVCGGCGKGTDLDTTCPVCTRRGRIRKAGPSFYRECPPPPDGCGASALVWKST